MKTLTVFALVCALTVLTRAAGLPEAEAGNALSEDAWYQFKGRSFQFVPKEMTWAQAEKNCQSMGGNLASIHDVQEYQEIQRLIMSKGCELKHTWVGGSDAQQEGYWLWTDGSAFRYTNWCQGEPNNLGGEHCLQINNSGKKCWNDRGCNLKYPSVCAKKP